MKAWLSYQNASWIIAVLKEIMKFERSTMPLQHLTFRPEIFRHRHFDRCMFWPCKCSGTWKFCLRGRFGTRTFRNHGSFGMGKFSAHGHFGMPNVHIALLGAQIFQKIGASNGPVRLALLTLHYFVTGRIHYRKANDLELCYLSSISISVHMVLQFSTAD